MDELISKTALQKTFEAECVGECGCCKYIKHNPEGCALIDDAPAVDAEPVQRGQWLGCENYNDIAQCSECGLIRNIYKQEGWNYCPNCGAKMDAEGQNDA